MLLCLLWPVTELLKGPPRPRNYSEVKGQRGSVYLAPGGGRLLDWHSHRWKMCERGLSDLILAELKWQWKSICI